MDRGADVNKQNQFGSTALHIACIHGNKRAVEELVKHGADPNMKVRPLFTGDSYCSFREMLSSCLSSKCSGTV